MIKPGNWLGHLMVSVCRLCILVDKFVYLEKDTQASLRGKRNDVSKILDESRALKLRTLSQEIASAIPSSLNN